MAVLLSLLVCLIGIAAVITKNKGHLPDSMSAMVYALPKKHRIIWTLWIWLMVALFTFALMDSLYEEVEFLEFFTIVSLGFCGAMPLAAPGENKAHDWLGVAGGVLSQVCVCLISPWWLLVWLVLPLLAALDTWAFSKSEVWERVIVSNLEGKLVFVLEAICAITLYGTLLFK
mgnify:CR=1 FL=1